MEFQTPKNPKVKWTPEQIKQKIETVDSDIKELQRDLNETQADLNVIFQRRYTLQHSISKKCIYKNQLAIQLKEAERNKDWVEL